MTHRLPTALSLLLGVVACTTDQPKGPAAVDAGQPAAVMAPESAPPKASLPDAGAPPVDAGAPVTVDAGVVAAAVESTPAPPPPKAAKGSVYDRILVKPKVRGTDPAEVAAIIEKKTGLKVELARKTAGSWVMIQLVAMPGGRDAKDQQKAVEQLQALGVFEVVEADRMMKVKMP